MGLMSDNVIHNYPKINNKINNNKKIDLNYKTDVLLNSEVQKRILVVQPCKKDVFHGKP